LLLLALSLQRLLVKDQSEIKEAQTLEKILFIHFDVAKKSHLFKNIILGANPIYYQLGYIELPLEQIQYCDEGSKTKLELSAVGQPQPCPFIIMRGRSESYLSFLVVITNNDEE
jgi:hypothetical protein